MNTNVYENTDSETITPLNKRRIIARRIIQDKIRRRLMVFKLLLRPFMALYINLVLGMPES